MDHRFLNYEVAELKDQIPTCENIARVIWNLLEPKISKGPLAQGAFVRNTGFVRRLLPEWSSWAHEGRAEDRIRTTLPVFRRRTGCTA